MPSRFRHPAFWCVLACAISASGALVDLHTVYNHDMVKN